MAMFSISDVRTYKKCRQLADFSMSSRRGLSPARPAIYYTVGTLAHEALERYYNGQSKAWEYYDEEIKKAVQSWRDFAFYPDLYEESISVTYILQAYMKRWAPAHDRFKLINTEVRDLIELPNGHHFTFKYDGLVQKPNGSIWIMEFKTTSSIPSDLGWLQIDDQASAYQWAVAQATGIKISGSIYTWIKKRVPSRPKELATGGVQERANIVTTAEVFYETVKQLGYDPADYRDFIKRITLKEGDDFFLRSEIVTSERQRKLMAKHLNEITTEMADENTLMYASPSERNCAKCGFFGPCAAKQLGLNYESLLASDDYVQEGYY